jgi:hypothetical protein
LRAPPVVEVEGMETDNTSLAAPPLICCIFLFPLLLYFYQIQKVDGRRYLMVILERNCGCWIVHDHGWVSLFFKEFLKKVILK